MEVGQREYKLRGGRIIFYTRADDRHGLWQARIRLSEHCYKQYSSCAGWHLYKFAIAHIRLFINKYLESFEVPPEGRHMVPREAPTPRVISAEKSFAVDFPIIASTPFDITRSEKKGS